MRIVQECVANQFLQFCLDSEGSFDKTMRSRLLNFFWFSWADSMMIFCVLSHGLRCKTTGECWCMKGQRELLRATENIICLLPILHSQWIRMDDDLVGFYMLVRFRRHPCRYHCHFKLLLIPKTWDSFVQFAAGTAVNYTERDQW